MNALQLTTRFRSGAYEGEACLLVYDELDFSESALSEDVRKVFDRRPATANLFVLVPFSPEPEIRDAILSGVALDRARPYFDGIGGRVHLITIRADGSGRASITVLPFEKPIGKNAQCLPEEQLNKDLRNGWLFDLFDSGGGRVDAPAGVHFGKASGRHADKFLRTSGALLTSTACATVAFFSFGISCVSQPSRIFVDTAPLIAIAFAMTRIAQTYGVWAKYSSVKSFSSYGGVDQLPRIRPSDLFLISASTSGGLANELINKGAKLDQLVTLFFLCSNSESVPEGHIICDLTYRNNGLYGYPKVKNYIQSECPLCTQGHFLAELEGDQFLLQKRGIKRLAVRASSQTADARIASERLARQGLLEVDLYCHTSRHTEITLDAETLLLKDQRLNADFIRLVRRFTPTKLDYVFLVNFSEQAFNRIKESLEVRAIFETAAIHATTDDVPNISGGTALVLFSCLVDHAGARAVNARMRSIVPGGCVAYITIVTVAESAQNLTDLAMFLSYGELGRDTFTYRSAMNLMLPMTSSMRSAWDAELELLQKIKNRVALPAELDDRLNLLQGSARTAAHLFHSGGRGELAIANDFVFLDTRNAIETISQADIYTVVSNVLACARNNNQGFGTATVRTEANLRWISNVYGHVLLCPTNFENYNDAVLRAAFLRAARPSELLYSVDEECSLSVFNVMKAEISAWNTGGGPSLPEMLIALATNRMRLYPTHLDILRAAIDAAQLPEHLKLIAEEIR